MAYSVQVPGLSLTELNILPLNVTQCLWDCMINARTLRLNFTFLWTCLTALS